MQISTFIHFVMIVPFSTLVAREQIIDMSLPEFDDRKAGWQIISKNPNSPFLEGNAGNGLLESKGYPVTFPRSGNYWVWIQYFAGGNANASAFYAVVRNDDTEVMAFNKFDWQPILPTERPWEVKEKGGLEGQNEWVWKSFEVVVDREMDGHIHFGALRSGGHPSPRRIGGIIVSDDRTFTPSGAEPLMAKNIDPVISSSEQEAPQGYQRAEGFPLHTEFFAGDPDPKMQFKMGLSYNASVFRDDARFVKMGFNRTHNVSPPPLFGIRQMRPMDIYHQMDASAAKLYNSPEGRFVNSKGEVGSLWSLTFPPLLDGLKKRTSDAMEALNDDPTVESLRIVAEVGGLLDYSPSSRREFQNWLSKKHPSIDELNELWGTKYKDFENIEPAVDASNKAAWFAFREFSGGVFAHAVKAQATAIKEINPRFNRLQQLSNLDLLSPRFTTMRPIDWEEFIDVALENENFVSWDAYSIDDYMGAEIELVRSLSGNRTLLNEEWNNHAPDPRIAGRTFWTMVGKGLRGVHCFQWQEGLFHDSYPKWALLNQDFSPKPKLAAIADAAHEVHRLERLIMASEPKDTTKPVAIYYSRLDLSLAKPLVSAWGEPIDTPYHVFATLRGVGYPVRWITPKQIEEGGLSEVGAVVLVDAQHIPKDACIQLAKWVKEGGAIIGDRWPGAYDEYGRTQEVLSEVFGIRAKPVRNTGPSQLALEESSQGYGEVTVSAITGEDMPNTVAEIWQQWDSSHPIAKALGPFTLSGYGRTAIQCVSGTVIGMTFGGDPGIVVNEFGKGKALYISMMLGSIYEGAATRYEWDSTHSGLAFHRLLSNFLSHSGLESFSHTDLPPRLQTKLRVERWLSDKKGNSLLMLTSTNDVSLKPFLLKVKWPEDREPPRMLLFSKNGTRELSPLKYAKKGNELEIAMPPFDTHATVLALSDSEPLVSIRLKGQQRNDTGLASVTINEEIEVEATVYNPSGSSLPTGNLEFWAPKGWFLSAKSYSIPQLEPFETATRTVRIKSPSNAHAIDLQPIVAKYKSGTAVSTPSTELIWWTP